MELLTYLRALADISQYTEVGCVVIDNIAPILGPTLSAVTAEGSVPPRPRTARSLVSTRRTCNYGDSDPPPPDDLSQQPSHIHRT